MRASAYIAEVCHEWEKLNRLKTHFSLLFCPVSFLFSCVSEVYLQLFPYEPLLFYAIAISFTITEHLFGLAFCSAAVWVVDPIEGILLPLPSLALQLAAQRFKILKHLH